MSTKVVIRGEPCSKANSRRLVKSKSGHPLFIKSQKALEYVKGFEKQCPQLDELMTEDVAVDITIYYASRRPDLDESLILTVFGVWCIKMIVSKRKARLLGRC